MTRILEWLFGKRRKHVRAFDQAAVRRELYPALKAIDRMCGQCYGDQRKRLKKVRKAIQTACQ